jgi:hypothetical protein
VICNDPKVLNHSLMMTIHTCISSRYVISLTNTTMVDCVKLMNDSRKQLLPRTLITPSEKRGQQFLLSPFVEVSLASSRRSNDCYKRLPTEHTHYLILPAASKGVKSFIDDKYTYIVYRPVVTLTPLVSCMQETSTISNSDGYTLNSPDMSSVYTNTTHGSDCVRLMNDSAMFKPPFSL